VEFALLLPVLLALMAGCIDYGWFFFQHTMAIHAVGEAARTGALMAEGAAGESAASRVVATAMAQAGADCGGRSASCTVTPSYLTAGARRVMRVDIDVRFASLTGFVPVPSTIHARSSAVLEQVDTTASDGCPEDRPGCSGRVDPTRTGAGTASESHRHR
jgi:hypothetical protein